MPIYMTPVTAPSTNSPLSAADEQRARSAFERWLAETSTSMAMTELAPHRGLCAGGEVTEADRRAAVRYRAGQLRKALRAALVDWSELPVGEDVVLGCWVEQGYTDLRRAQNPEREYPSLLRIADASPGTGGASAAQTR